MFTLQARNQSGRMQFPNWAKLVWWLVLVLVLGAFLMERLPDLLAGNSEAADVVVFGVWMALMLAPLFSEVSLLGVTLKQEIDELKGHVAAQVAEVRSEVRNAIDVRTNFSPTFNIPSPPSDAQLPEIERRLRGAIESAFTEYGSRVRPPGNAEISEDVQYLFATRFQIEKELRRIAAFREVTLQPRRPLPTQLLARSLVESGLLSPRLADAIREVYAVCSPAIHGEDVSQAQVEFVRDIGPKLISALRAVPD